MARSLTIISIFLVLLLGNGCQSPLSKGKLNELSALDVRIEITQDLINKKKNEVNVFIYDTDGKPIRNKSIKIKVNAADLLYSERQELYYNMSSKYSLSNVQVANKYSFHITLSNGRSYFLGSITPLAENREENIVCAERGNLDQDFIVYWKNLADINELTVTKGVLLSNSTQLHQNFDYEPLPTKAIGRNGKYTVSKTNYINPKSTIRSLEVKFAAARSGTMNPQLAEGSSIRISGHIDRFIEFYEKNGK